MANPINDLAGSWASDAAADAAFTAAGWAKSDGVRYYNTSVAQMKIWNASKSAWVYESGSPRMFTTYEGGLALVLTNRTGSASVKGTVVISSTAQDNAFAITGEAEAQPIGVVYEDGVSENSECAVVITGRAQVLLEDTTASTRGNWVYTSDDVGRANATLAAPPGGGIPELDEHMQEIGHCLESQGSGQDVLAYCLLHFN